MDVVFSMVGENRPDRWTDQMLNAVLAIRTFGGSLADAPVMIGLVEGARRDLREALESLGAHVRVVEPGHGEYRYANKLRALELPAGVTADVVVCIDVDVAVLGDIAAHVPADAVGVRIAARDRWPEDLWLDLFERWDLPVPSERHLLLYGQRSFRYANTGVVTVPWRYRDALRERWGSYVERLWEVGDLMPQRYLNDQYALAFALYDLGVAVAELPAHLNFNWSWTPDLLAGDYRDHFRPPFVLHYHKELDRDGSVRHVAYEPLNPLVDELNRRRRGVMRPPRPLAQRLPPAVANSRAYTGARHLYKQAKALAGPHR